MEFGMHSIASPRRLRLLVAALLAATFAAIALASPAFAQDAGDNSATAVNTENGSTQIDIAFDFQKVMNGIVNNGNSAHAYASCEECQTIAIAIQIVLVMGDVDVVAPTNVAEAVNVSCVACVTVALAYQFVWGDGGRYRLTGEARRQLAALAKAFRALEESGGSANEVLSQTNQLLNQLSDVLATGLEPIGPNEDRAAADDAASDDSAAAEPTPEAGANADETPAPSGADDPSSTAPTARDTSAPDASASPEPDATAEPSPAATP